MCVCVCVGVAEVISRPSHPLSVLVFRLHECVTHIHIISLIIEDTRALAHEAVNPGPSSDRISTYEHCV